MEIELINFYSGINVHPLRVRVMIFNDAFNIYEAETDSFINSFPLKGAATNIINNDYFIYSQNREVYIQFSGSNPSAEGFLNEVKNANKSLINKLLRHRAISLLFITLVLMAGLYFAIIWMVPYFGAKMISKETEIDIGKNLKTTMLAQEEISGAGVDSVGTEKLQEFVNKLSLSANYPINVTMVNNNAINAYAMPGGEIVVYSGIVKKMDSYEELVALLAHESTHVNKRHTLNSLLRSAANSIILSVLFGDPGGISGVIAGNIQNLNGLHYSRSLETEADEKGMELMMANKVDLKGMSRLMELLKKEDHLPGSLTFLSTHPLTDERISNVGNFIKTHKNNYTEHEDLKAIFMSMK